MPEWLVEGGIGETRFARIVDGEIVEVRIVLEGIVPAGSVVEAQLLSCGTSGRNAVARSETGDEYLLPRGAPGVSEGRKLRIEVTRERIPGAEPWKRPLARVTESAIGEPAGPKAEPLPFPAPYDHLAGYGWDDIIEEARSGIDRYAGGELAIQATKAMTLIDVDGLGEPAELARLGAVAAARAILRLDMQGSIGIDLPTATRREARQSAAAAVDAILPQPFERTSVNGFGFLQIVRPRRRASLIELAADRASFEARALLRRAAFAPPGPKTLVAAPAVIAVMERHPEWIAELGRQLGGAVTLRSDPTLTISAGHAEPA